MDNAYVALIQQGMVVAQVALATGDDREVLRREAEHEAKRRNDAQTGEGEGWTASVVRVEHPGGRTSRKGPPAGSTSGMTVGDD